MSTTQTETIGIGYSVSKQLDQDRNILQTGGMNVSGAKVILDAAVEEARALNAKQETLKHDLTEITKQVEEKMHRAYVITSGTIDTMMAAVEKDSKTAKVYQRLRSRLRQAGDQTAEENTTEETLPVPVPEATK